jgi:acylglycerol lipase
VVQYLVPRGYALYGFDLIGHGRSPGTRVYVERFEDYTETLQIYQAMVWAWQPQRPLHLLGHSVGGLIVPYYLLDHAEGLAGAILSAPSVVIPDNISQLTVMLGRLLSRLAPKAGIMGIDAGAVSRDPAVVQAYDTDPLVYRGKTTARLAAELLRAMQRVNAEAGRIRLPLLILQGSEDRLVDPEGAQILYDKVRSEDITLQVYPGLHHEVFNEPEHDQVLADVEAWLEARR